MSLKGIYFLNCRLQKAELLKYPKKAVSEHLWTVNILKGLKYSVNLHRAIFLIFFEHSVRKSAPKALV